MMCIWYKSYIWYISGLSLQLIKLLHNCEDHFHFYSLSAVHWYIWFISSTSSQWKNYSAKTEWKELHGKAKLCFISPVGYVDSWHRMRWEARAAIIAGSLLFLMLVVSVCCCLCKKPVKKEKTPPKVFIKPSPSVMVTTDSKVPLERLISDAWGRHVNASAAVRPECWTCLDFHFLVSNFCMIVHSKRLKDCKGKKLIPGLIPRPKEFSRLTCQHWQRHDP